MMNIIRVRHIDGPNVYLYKPVLQARIDLGTLTERESSDIPGFADALLHWLPGLREHYCAKGAPGGFVERLYGGTYFGHVVEHVTIELACCLGLDVHFGKTVYAGGTGLYDIVMECKSFPCQRTLLGEAVVLVEQLLARQTPNPAAALAAARADLCAAQFGPSTQAIVDAAVARQIPVRRLGEGSLLQLGYGKYRRLVEATVTDLTSAIAVDIACDKEMTKRMLCDAGIPVPEGGVVDTVQGAIAKLLDIGPPVAVKPYNGNQGKGVSLNLWTEEDVVEAFQIAREYASSIMVERYVTGRNVRLLVVNNQFVAASERVPAQVRGDGARSIRDLVAAENRNPRRGDDHEKPLTRIAIDEVVMHTLRRQSFTLDDVPPAGQLVLLRDSANLSTGGEAIDITDELHVSYKEIAERAARLIGLDVCGLDLILPEPGQPFADRACAVIELNAAPGIRMHQHPSYGTARCVGDAIVRSLFPTGSGRIPIFSVTGTNGKTTTTRLIGHSLRMAGKRVGMTTTGGVVIDGKTVCHGDTTGPDSARSVLADPAVEVAVLETARGGIVRGGLAYDKANIAVITNITADHIGQDGVTTLEDLVHIKSLVAECVHDDGTVVLNADDERLLELAPRLAARIVLFAQSSANRAFKRHLGCGGVGYYTQRGWIVEARGHLTWEVTPLADIPICYGGSARFQVENCLAATGALRAYGLTRQQIAKAFSEFTPQVDNPGRCAFYRMPNGSYVMIDYGHNPDGFRKVGDWLALVPHQRLVAVVGVPGDRDDSVVRDSAVVLADAFDSFYVKEDEDKRGRREGEIAAIMATAIHRRCPQKHCAIVLNEAQALRQAVVESKPGDVVAVFHERVGGLSQALAQLGAVASGGPQELETEVGVAVRQ